MTFDEWLASSPYYHLKGGVNEPLLRQVWDAAIDTCRATIKPFAEFAPRCWDVVEDHEPIGACGARVGMPTVGDCRRAAKAIGLPAESPTGDVGLGPWSLDPDGTVRVD